LAKRQQSMATIDTVLQQAQATKLQTAADDTLTPPTIDDAVPGKPEEKEQKAPPPPKAPPESAYEKKVREAYEKLVTEEEARKHQEEVERERNKSAFQKNAEGALSSGKRIWKGTNLKIGNIPTPGSIVVPLVLLIVVFFILVQVNGFSRLGWLWLVVSGQAQVTTSDQSGPPANTPPPPKPGEGGIIVHGALNVPLTLGTNGHLKSGMMEAY